MNKFILPALICIIALTSCSQALYKNKYDWVKVEPQPKQAMVRTTAPTVTTETVVEETSAEVEEHSVNTPLAVESGQEVLTVDSANAPREQQKIASEQVEPVEQPVHALKEGVEKKSVAHAPLKARKQRSSSFAWEDGTLKVILGVLICLLLVLGFQNVVMILLYGALVVGIIMAVATAALIIYGLLWLCGLEIDSGIFFWTSK